MKHTHTAAALAALALSAAADAQTATTQRSVRQAYGARLGDQAADPNDTGVTGRSRLSQRVDTRINSRISMRIERYTPRSGDIATALKVATDAPARREFEAVPQRPVDEPEE